jgi:hypothetical protein
MDLTPALRAEYKFLKNEVRKREAESISYDSAAISFGSAATKAIQELWAARKELKEFRLQLQKEGYKI